MQEMLDVKLKLKQVELDMLKLRSKQAQINNGKQGSLPSGLSYCSLVSSVSDSVYE
jgi:hypothetical protein